MDSTGCGPSHPQPVRTDPNPSELDASMLTPAAITGLELIGA
ncbi:hypothetical protein [Nonomuraea rosea]